MCKKDKTKNIDTKGFWENNAKILGKNFIIKNEI